jgi:hypothetical protein
VRVDGGSSTTLGATAAQTVSVGDKLGIRAIGSTIEAWYYDSSAGTWSFLFSRTDSTYSSAGYIAMESRGSALDDFGGGTANTSSFSIVSPYDGTANNVGLVNSTVSTIFTSGAPLVGGTGAVQLKVRPSNTTPEASDYSETITLIAAASF